MCLFYSSNEISMYLFRLHQFVHAEKKLCGGICPVGIISTVSVDFSVIATAICLWTTSVRWALKTPSRATVTAITTREVGQGDAVHWHQKTPSKATIGEKWHQLFLLSITASQFWKYVSLPYLLIAFVTLFYFLF